MKLYRLIDQTGVSSEYPLQVLLKQTDFDNEEVDKIAELKLEERVNLDNFLSVIRTK